MQEKIQEPDSSAAMLRAVPRRSASRLDALPPANARCWGIRRKTDVVVAVRSGAISLEDACERYNLSMEEFLTWQRLIDSHRKAGIRVTRLQNAYRQKLSRRPPKASPPR